MALERAKLDAAQTELHQAKSDLESLKASTVLDLQAEKAKTADMLTQLEDQRRVTDEETLQRKALEEELAEEKSKAAAALTAIEQAKALEIEELRQRTNVDHEHTRLLLKTAQTEIPKLQAR